jgi:hypothetical protein
MEPKRIKKAQRSPNRNGAKAYKKGPRCRVLARRFTLSQNGYGEQYDVEFAKNGKMDKKAETSEKMSEIPQIIRQVS